MNADPVENVLNEFRAWLHQGGAQGDLPSAEEEAIDLNALLREMVALKHEVNLQTRASRAQLDQNAEAVKQLRGTAGKSQVQDAEIALVSARAPACSTWNSANRTACCTSVSPSISTSAWLQKSSR